MAERQFLYSCHVCGSPSPGYSYLGGQVCYSCRAFFRRTVSRMKKKGVKTCRTSEGKCDTSQLFKSCMNCRYRKCLRIGMRPELIGGNAEGEISETERQRDIAPPPQPRSRTEETPRGGREGEPEILSYTDQLLQSTFYNSLGQHRPRGELTQQQVDRILSEVREEIEEKQRQEGQEVQRTEDSRTVTEDLVKIQEDDVRIGLGYIPSMMGPEMCLTIEEKNVLGQLFGKQITACRNCCPVSLFQARVGTYLGKLTMEEMLDVFATSRKAQNYYHYTLMTSMPGFKAMTSRTQNKLLLKNLQLCFSLFCAYYFFGHTAKTAIEQEEQTGFVTGLGDYIRSQAPYALDMGVATYGDYFKTPWATSREFEDKHREISFETGHSLKDVGKLGYLILYGLAVYNISDQELTDSDIPAKDVSVIREVQKLLTTIYSRLLKNRVGWKRASYKILNQRYILDKMNQVMMIHTMENLQLNDLSNSQSIRVETGEKRMREET